MEIEEFVELYEKEVGDNWYSNRRYKKRKKKMKIEELKKDIDDILKDWCKKHNFSSAFTQISNHSLRTKRGFNFSPEFSLSFYNQRK